MTICTYDCACLFGEVMNGEMQWNEYGAIAKQLRLDVPREVLHVELDAFVVMLDHIHGIVVITATNVGARDAVCLPHAVRLPPQRMEHFGKPVPGAVSTVVRSFKFATTKCVNEQRGTPGAPVWQRNYYEHIIRNEASLNRIRQYILGKPLRWAMDRENPDAVDREPEEAWRA